MDQREVVDHGAATNGSVGVAQLDDGRQWRGSPPRIACESSRRREHRLRYVLVHSPLVGPATLRPLADELSGRGHDVVLPDLRGVTREPNPTWLVEAAVAAVSPPSIDVAVAHSGSGAVLPSIAASVDARVEVFLDAVLPDATADVHRTPERQRALLEEHVDEDGLLQPWLSWWPTDVVERMLPDPDLRRVLQAEAVRLPLSFYDHEIALPRRWTRSGFIALGGAYANELAEAQRRGWPTRRLSLTHLATATDPVTTADAITSLVAELTRTAAREQDR